MGKDRDQWLIDGRDLGAPVNWRDFEINAVFSQEDETSPIDENQASLSIESLIWTGPAAEYISNRFKSGLTGGPGAFQGVPVSWVISNETGSFTAFQGYIDFTQNYRERKFKGPRRTQPTEVVTTIVDDFGIDSLIASVNGITMDTIREDFNSSDWTDIPFVIIKKFDFIEFFMMWLSLYVILKSLADARRALDDLFADIPTNPLGLIGWIAKLILTLAYIAFLLAQLIVLVQQIINLLFSKKRIHKGLKLKKLLEVGLTKAGYTFVSPIEELDFYTILPTLPTEKSNFLEELFNKVRVTKEGLPSVNDYGFAFLEVMTLCRNLFNARFAVYNNNGTKEVHLRTKGDQWWFKQSNQSLLEAPDGQNILVDDVGYNLEELKLNRYLKFSDDPLDIWTKEDKQGLTYEVQTRSSPNWDEGGIPLEKGLDFIQIPYALGSRKAFLTDLEEFVLTVVSTAESVINFFGGNLNFSDDIRARMNFLKISSPEISVPKLLYIENGGIPPGHRGKLGAKILQEKYYRSSSFVNASDAEPFNNQYQTFEGIDIQFDLTRFLETRQNSYFITKDGESGKIESFNWKRSEDKATLKARFRFVYDKSLTETTFELKNDDD
ncbi:MAG: hypothetical protein HRU18_12040 [Pseudoalteromonas sp.]|uniref:hypothetical protein n=1 Tax=Pseudoalteromonas sp. TaxID=53249 RepID=UPI001D530BC0|nr:hypothetical protein [Pseudoalteromonas sp.]NRA78932.1 hypothetical protein [Pseudoalteromonas sp.]